MKTTLPLFPLPEVVLFPRTHLHLHVFEPRYAALIEQVVARDRRLAVCQLRPGWERDYQGAPPVCRIAGAGRVLIADRGADGKWNLLVEGIERIRIGPEVRTNPFRVARVAPLVEAVDERHREETLELMHSTARLAEALGRKIPSLGRKLGNLVNQHQHPGVVCDVIASELVADPYARQSILGELNILRRLRLLSIQLDHLVAALRQKGLEVPPPGAE